MNFERLEQDVINGYISKRRHPLKEIPYFIYNYTAKTEYDNYWNDETRVCRGLILDENNVTISKPFEKFFNYNQVKDQIPDESFDIFEKLDGSLGISYYHVFNGWSIATRGSFESDQAVFATNLLRSKYAGALYYLDPNLTYLFEIIYPENRIVVNYEDREELILLAVFNTATGKELDLYQFSELCFPIVNKYPPISLEKLLTIQEKNKEGFVLRFKNGFRVKIKFEEYKRIHKMLSLLSDKYIWEMMMNNQSFHELEEILPQIQWNWVKTTYNKYLHKFESIRDECYLDFFNRPETNSRKEIAEYFKNKKHPKILFAMLDKKPINPIIWNTIKP